MTHPDPRDEVIEKLLEAVLGYLEDGTYGLRLTGMAEHHLNKINDALHFAQQHGFGK